MLRVLHIITGLSMEGAELNLLRLLMGMNKNDFSNTVVSLLAGGEIKPKIRDLGVPVFQLNMRRGVSNPFSLKGLLTVYREFKPSVVHCWMNHSNFLGGLIGLIRRDTPVIWDIHHSAAYLPTDKLLTRAITFGCGKLSWFDSATSRIIFCGHATMSSHVEYGYNPRKMTVIPNGFDTDIFYPDGSLRQKVRYEIGLSDDSPVIGIIARDHPDKDIPNFLKSASWASARNKDLRFVMVGSGLDSENQSLMNLIRSHGLERVTTLLGVREDIPAIINSFDLLTLSSSTESFPNVIGEAMACGVPCVATDVGDTALLIGAAGKVVPPRRPEELAQAWLDIVCLEQKQKEALGAQARQRILEKFPLSMMTTRYEQLYEAVTAEMPFQKAS